MTRTNGAVPRVLFVCMGNTCRSMMAEHFTRALYGSRVVARSAGLSPGSLSNTKDAVAALKAFGIDGAGHVPRRVSVADFGDVDYVVAMNMDVADRLRSARYGVPLEKLVAWPIDDPWGKPPEDYLACAEQIRESLVAFFDDLGIAPTKA